MRDEITLVRDMFQQLMATLAGRYKRIQMTAGIYRDEDCRTPFAFYGGQTPEKAQFASGKDIAQLKAFLQANCVCEANATNTEQMGAALHYGAHLPWTAQHRLIVHVGDNPSFGFMGTPEHCRFGLSTEQVIDQLKQNQVRTYMVQSYNNKNAAKEYAQIANATGGRHIPLSSFSVDDLAIIIEAAVTHAVGGTVRTLLESATKQGRLGAKPARLLLGHFEDESNE